jgi:hypothetical protein
MRARVGRVCVTKLLLTSECRLGDVPSRSPVSGNSERSLYRVLRLAPRGAGRSVDRERAGRNASSVKGPSPDKQSFPWWPSQYQEAKAAPRSARVPSGTVVESVSDSTRQRPDLGTTGVQDRGMYAEPAVESERAARSRTNVDRPRSRAGGQGVTTKSTPAILRAAVRCAHSSEVRISAHPDHRFRSITITCFARPDHGFRHRDHAFR